MRRNKAKNIANFDCDGTLVLYDIYNYPVKLHKEFKYYGMSRILVPHREQIELLKAYKKQGFFIRVHTNNGEPWANEIVTKLGLQDFVDETSIKPAKTVDDKNGPSNEVTGQSVFIPPDPERERALITYDEEEDEREIGSDDTW